ncbi:MAG TPA: hypothetical protein VL527_09145, partial [Dongiaceae bacterium]|nr:hypothetical protein [Dongiaceae bacterium]
VTSRPGYSCIDAYFDCITEQSGRSQFSSKAKVRVWMASQVDFEYHVGKAAQEGYWPWDDPAFAALTKFLREL